ncbi:hypothetical protein CLIB1444_01S02498 [[Candida] jaroonii]|uniref:Uncharacterized protein n=1 Tax=[Candida] jaroonii TaxID=467808 RepID=A0ACA9Y022_9ASCO|nr:hypothetical protein CLIB1444_01S02498 [[Candida] jaroonii]
MRFLRFLHSTSTFYEILELPRSCTIDDVKKQFKVLSKKYHPDLNNHLPEDEKQDNADKFIRIVNAYEILKDKKKRQEYDMTLNPGLGSSPYSRGPETFNYSYNNSQKEYYGEARYQNSSRLNRTRHKVRNFNEFGDNDTTFSGRHVNYGDRNNVPHFNYEEHLSKHLKFEQRIINRQFSKEEREAILKQLTKTYDISELSEELVTKHLKRQINRKSKPIIQESISVHKSDPFIYRRPEYTQEEEMSGLRVIAILGGASGGLFMMYKAIFG